MPDLKRKDKVYYARILPLSATYEICELIVRTVEEDWFVGVDKQDKHAYLFNYDKLNKTVFTNRKDALNKVKLAESQRKDGGNIE